MKTYKKGTVVTFYATCDYPGCESFEVYELEDDLTEEQLNNMAWQYALDSIQPEGHFKVME